MASSQDYEIGTTALAAVIAQAIKDNVPEFLMRQVEAHQNLISQIETQGAKAVIDAVDVERTKAAT